MSPLEAETMYRDKFPSICRFVRRLGADPEAAEEVAQDSFVRILSLPDLVKRKIETSYWLRAAQSVYRRRGRNRSEALPPSVCAKSPEEPPNLPATWSGLTPNEFAVVRCVCSGMTYEQTARSIGTTCTNVTNLKHRGIGKLRKMVSFSE